jgi:ubiquinone/menaquinone biosynthesis C-methylase UbiE
LNVSKAEFFDSQVEADWAHAEYCSGEMEKIDRIFQFAGLKAGMRVLEPGCGTGRLTRIIAERVGPDGHVLAIDISSGMIEVCKKRLSSFRSADVCCGAVEDLSVEDGTFDLVVCHNVFPHFDCKRTAVSHLVSALTAAGKFIVCHFMDSTGINDLHRKVHPSVLNDLLPSEPEMREIFGAAGLQVGLLEDSDGYLLVSARI